MSTATLTSDDVACESHSATPPEATIPAPSSPPGPLAATWKRINPFRLLAHPRLFGFWETLDIHVTPKHFYQPIPDTGALPESLWERHSTLPGIEINLDAMETFLAEFGDDFGDEWAAIPADPVSDPLRFHMRNGRYESVDAEILYGMVRRFAPKRIVEVGCGRSTLLALEAIERNRQENPSASTEYVSIDPFPPSYVTNALKGRGEQLIAPVQDVPLDVFTNLGDRDILFIDSTHVLCIGSDVQYEFLEILPRLRAGVIVHIHDVFLPMEYPRPWIKKHRMFWTEQYLLQAFLAFNSAFETLWAGHLMHCKRPEALSRWIPSYEPSATRPGSYWMRRVA